MGAVNPGITVPQAITFDAQGNLLICCYNNNMVARYDRGVVVTLSAASSTPVSVNYATADGSATRASTAPRSTRVPTLTLTASTRPAFIEPTWTGSP